MKIMNKETNVTELMSKVINEKWTAAERLIEESSKEELNALDKDSENVLFYFGSIIFYERNYEIAKKLLKKVIQKGCNIHQKSRYGYTCAEWINIGKRENPIRQKEITEILEGKKYIC